MLVTTKIKIDLQRPSYPMVVNAVQGEQNTRQIELSLYSGCVAWMVPDNVAVAMRYSKPDKTKGYYDTMPDGSASFTVSENRILAFLAPQMLTVPGTVVAQIVLYQGTQTLATFSIHIRVEADPSAGAVTSEDYVNWAQWIKSELDAYLEKLKINGEFVGGTFVGDVNMNGHALSGLREPVAPDDAASKEYVDKNAGSGSVSSVAGVAPDADGNVPLDASSVKALPIGGGKMEGPINMNGQPIRGLNAPTEDSQAANKGYVDLRAYPVGAIYASADSTSPASLFGGTWEQLKDRFLLGAGDTYAAGSTGGEATHKLTVAEMPKHTHEFGLQAYGAEVGSVTVTGNASQATLNKVTNEAGGNSAHNNMPPYIAVYMWKRVA